MVNSATSLEVVRSYDNRTGWVVERVWGAYRGARTGEIRVVQFELDEPVKGGIVYRKTWVFDEQGKLAQSGFVVGFYSIDDALQGEPPEWRGPLRTALGNRNVL